MNDTNMPGADAAMTSFSAATKSMQDFANEMQRISKQSMDSTTQMMDKLRGAKTIEEVVSIQSSFMQQSFANYADCTRRFSELMMTLPMELAKQSRTAMQHGAESFSKATEQAGQQVQNASQEFNKHQG